MSVSQKKLKKIAQRKQLLQQRTEETRRQQKKKRRLAKLTEFYNGGADAEMRVEEDGTGTVLGSADSHMRWMQ